MAGTTNFLSVDTGTNFFQIPPTKRLSESPPHPWANGAKLPSWAALKANAVKTVSHTGAQNPKVSTRFWISGGIRTEGGRLESACANGMSEKTHLNEN